MARPRRLSQTRSGQHYLVAASLGLVALALPGTARGQELADPGPPRTEQIDPQAESQSRAALGPTERPGGVSPLQLALFPPLQVP